MVLEFHPLFRRGVKISIAFFQSAFSGHAIKIDGMSFSAARFYRVKCRCARRGSGRVYFSKAIYHVFDYLSQRQVAAPPKDTPRWENI
jgi:hypothetical protein